MVEISTSLLTVKKENIIKTIYNLETAHTDYFHIDVMDGQFVKNDTNSLMQEYCEYINSISNIPLDVHLMVKDVKSYIKSYMIFNPNIITFQIEALETIQQRKEIIQYIKDNGCKAGIAIKPNTPINQIYDLLPLVHMVLVMTVEPGEGGQKLIPQTIEKIKELKDYLKNQNIELDIEADGGINSENIEEIKSAGTDIIVSGSWIINSMENQENWQLTQYK